MTTNYITYRPYFKDEIKFIKENYTGEKQNVLYLAERLQRSKWSIMEQARKMGLSNKIKREKLYNFAPLTKREKEVLVLLYKGLSVREIAQELCVEISTIRTHKTSILYKLDVNSVLELLAKRIEELENNQLTTLSKNLIAEVFLEKLKENVNKFLESEE